jgi:hypothetical protein
MPDHLERTWFRPGLEVAASTIHGRGLFTDAPIAAGDVVMVWGGARYTRTDLVSGHVPSDSSYSFIDEDVLLSGPGDDPDYFVNHSCRPSVWMSDAVTVVAARDLSSGDEITGDYAVWEGSPDYVLDPCRCGSVACRGRITGDDWRIPDVQATYAGHFLPYLQRRIDRSHP